jgi:hypothetical protein
MVRNKDKFAVEKAFLEKHGVTNRVPPKLLRYLYWRHRISALIVFAVIAVLIWFMFHIGYW